MVKDALRVSWEPVGLKDPIRPPGREELVLGSQSGRGYFDKAVFRVKFGERTTRVGRSVPGGGTTIETVRVDEEYGRLISQAREAETRGDGEGYFQAVSQLAHFMGQEIGEDPGNQRGGDMGNTRVAAGRALSNMGINDETSVISTGEDWVTESDTLNNQRIPHQSGTDGANLSEGVGTDAVGMFNTRGCGYITAKLVDGHHEMRGRTVIRPHSPKVVEIHVTGFRGPGR
ncbi:MAG: hypothetical protein WC841_05580 [Candidatus Shapirobacteria bacterium]|jgi:hypothetical protein